jgi:hypothetical protein
MLASHVMLGTFYVDTAQQQSGDDRLNLRNYGFMPTSFADPFGAYDSSTGNGSLDASSIVQGCDYTSGRGAFGLHNITATNDTRPYAATIPPLNLFKIKTRAASTMCLSAAPHRPPRRSKAASPTPRHAEEDGVSHCGSAAVHPQ